ncbi:hypothetical protein FQ377_13805 [Arthrobacter echini]|uniref:Conjugal transfer protein TrbC n=1 Tax=Arthrobacter echini TaxID=1529066 RepID=A0A5D0XJZ5_9MICC|nr:hypothetical protein [Arthrobacter echini]TYC96598.1 hypothetical protein FQ377_13805 [Arthrobacter echini]
MNHLSPLSRIAVPSAPRPMPQGVQDGLDTIIFWVQTVGGSLAVVGLMVLAIGLFFAHRGGQGGEFMAKVGWWAAGASLLGLAAIIAPIFLGL